MTGFGPVEGMHVEYMWHVHDFGYEPVEGFDAGGRRIVVDPWVMRVTGWTNSVDLSVVIEGQTIRADGQRGKHRRQHIYRTNDHGRWGVRTLDELPDWACTRLAEARARHERTDSAP